MKRSLWIKRCCSLLLALCLLSALALPAFAGEAGFLNFQNKPNEYTDGMFPDVPETWYTVDVKAVYELGLMKGSTDGLFHPDDGVTIAETTALAARLHSIYFTGSADFTQGQPWYQVYVDYCRENGILRREYENWNAKAKRSEFAALLSRALPESALPQINEIEDGQIPDVAVDDAYAAEIYELYRAGILTGNDAYGTFLPDSEIKRSEVAAVVARMAYRSLRKTVTLTPKPPYPVLEEAERLEDDCFSDAAMLGHSLVDGMMIYSKLPMDFYGVTSGTVGKNKLDALLLKQKQYDKVYIEFGINDFGLSLEKFIDGYRKIIGRVREALPEAEIIVMAITPVTKGRSAEGIFTMTKIREWNGALYALAEEEQCWYLDCCTPLCDGEGYLPTQYGGWDKSPHLSDNGYLAWAEVIRTHAVPNTAGEN